LVTEQQVPVLVNEREEEDTFIDKSPRMHRFLNIVEELAKEDCQFVVQIDWLTLEDQRERSDLMSKVKIVRIH